jgi:hypothetical protein
MENYTDEDPEEGVIVETLEVETSVLPVEEDYEPEPVLPYPVRKMQLEYFSREHFEDENESKSKAKVKPPKRRKQEKPIETMEEEVTCFMKGCIKAADTGKPVVPCSFGSTSYYGLCDIGSSINVIPYTLYTKLHDEIYACDLQPTDMEIKVADGTLRRPYGVVPHVNVILGTFTY